MLAERVRIAATRMGQEFLLAQVRRSPVFVFVLVSFVVVVVVVKLEEVFGHDNSTTTESKSKSNSEIETADELFKFMHAKLADTRARQLQNKLAHRVWPKSSGPKKIFAPLPGLGSSLPSRRVGAMLSSCSFTAAG